MAAAFDDDSACSSKYSNRTFECVCGATGGCRKCGQFLNSRVQSHRLDRGRFEGKLGGGERKGIVKKERQR